MSIEKAFASISLHRKKNNFPGIFLKESKFRKKKIFYPGWYLKNHPESDMVGSRANLNKRENKSRTRTKLRDHKKSRITLANREKAADPSKGLWTFFSSGPRRPYLGCLLFQLAASLAFFKRFSSSKSDAILSEMYSSTTFQPSTLLLAILISFCRLQMSSCSFVYQII